MSTFAEAIEALANTALTTPSAVADVVECGEARALAAQYADGVVYWCAGADMQPAELWDGHEATAQLHIVLRCAGPNNTSAAQALGALAALVSQRLHAAFAADYNAHPASVSYQSVPAEQTAHSASFVWQVSTFYNPSGLEIVAI